MATEGSRSISISGDRRYVDAVHLVARSRGTTSARLVREALDKLYGSELSKFIAFLAKNEPQTVQLEQEK